MPERRTGGVCDLKITRGVEVGWEGEEKRVRKGT